MTKNPIPILQPSPWHVEDSFGAFFVVAVVALLAVTLWLGWPEVSGWLFSR